MIVVDLLRAALIATVPLAFLGGWLSMTHLFLLAFAVGTLSVAFDISWSTLFVAVAKRDEYVQANSLLNGSRSLSGVAGPSIGGVLIHFLGAPMAMLTDAVSFIASALFLTRVQAVEPPVEHQPGSLRSQLASGLRFILRDEIMRPTVLSAATLNLFNFGFQALFILYVTTYLGVDPGVLGLALGAGAIGAVVGALTASRIGRRLGLGPAFVLGLIIFPAALILVPLAGGPMPLILAALFTMEFVGGFGVMVLDINAGAIIPARTPDRIRSRVTGSFRFINMGVRPIGALLGGYLGGVLGVRETLFVVTIASLLGVLWLVGTPVWRLKDMPEVAEIA
jgi:predicted MFS family arabinose efflux permease